MGARLHDLIQIEYQKDEMAIPPIDEKLGLQSVTCEYTL